MNLNINHKTHAQNEQKYTHTHFLVTNQKTTHNISTKYLWELDKIKKPSQTKTMRKIKSNPIQDFYSRCGLIIFLSPRQQNNENEEKNTKK